MNKLATASKQLCNLKKRLFQAAKSKDFLVFEKITSNGINPFTKDNKGVPAIYYLFLGNLDQQDLIQFKEFLNHHSALLRNLRTRPMRQA